MSTERKYKLKRQAREFFPEKYHTMVLYKDYWQREGFRDELLEEVQKVSVEYGKPLSKNATDCKGWAGAKSEGHFHFTVRVYDITSKEYENLQVAEMLDMIQSTLNRNIQL